MSYNGSTADFDSVNGGSIPSVSASPPLGGARVRLLFITLPPAVKGGSPFAGVA